MATNINILIIEDSPDDVELISRTLEKAGLQTNLRTIDSFADLEQALQNSEWDIILSDYNLPGFNGLRALTLCQEHRPGTPFILVSGAVGEEKAVDFMRAGARDFVSKSNLKRLIPAIQRELASQARADNLEKELLSTLETMSEGLVTLDRNWTVIYVNHEAENYFQRPRETVLGKTLMELYQSPDLEKFLSRYRRVLKNGTPEKFIETYEDRVMHIHAIRTIHGGISIFFRNITDQVHAEKKQQELMQNLKLAKKEAEKANQLKSAFLANMSHEIRTPLGAILGFADLLKDPKFSAEEKMSFINIIDRNGHQLSRLLNDILDLSKVESGHLTIEKARLSPFEIVQEVVELLQVKAHEKSIQVSLTAESDLPKYIYCDGIRLRQILTNIIGNAIKFTQFGSVDVRLHQTKAHELAIEVKDSGIGIEPSGISNLFQVFRQADGSITRKYGGTGLGLALSRRLAQAMGGDVVLVETGQGKGSTFLITIGFEGAEDELVKPEVDLSSNEVAFETRPGIKILLIEDSPDNQHLISRILLARDVDLEMVDNGSEGIKRALEGHHDLILMDIQMPGIDGFTATQRLRELGFAKPIIALTAHAMNEVREKCFAVGFTDHLTKPIDRLALLSTIGKHSQSH